MGGAYQTQQGHPAQHTVAVPNHAPSLLAGQPGQHLHKSHGRAAGMPGMAQGMHEVGGPAGMQGGAPGGFAPGGGAVMGGGIVQLHGGQCSIQVAKEGAMQQEQPAQGGGDTEGEGGAVDWADSQNGELAM